MCVELFGNYECYLLVFYCEIDRRFARAKVHTRNKSVADPGHTILPNFPKNCMKLKEFGPGGRASLAPPLDSPLQIFAH